MGFVISRGPRLSPALLIPSLPSRDLPTPVAGRPAYYHFWARNAIYNGLRALGVKAGDKVLVPAYHCATMVEPIIQYGAQVTFFNIFQDGSADFEDIEAKVDEKTLAVVAIHYFGNIQPIRHFQELCRKHGLFLIEDCAHLLIGETNGEAVGSFGDISIFSWRKFLPVYDGGVLVLNNPACQGDITWDQYDIWFQLKIAKNLVEKTLYDSLSWYRRGSAKQSTSSLNLPTLQNNETQTPLLNINKYSQEFDLSLVDLPMSGFSKCILKKLDLRTIVKARQRNSMKLLKVVEALPGVSPWVETSSEHLDGWAFPLIVHSRDDLHVELREKGVEAFTWGGVIHPSMSIQEFPDSEFLYRRLVLIPNHQSLTDTDMQWLIQVLEETVLCSKSYTTFEC